MAEKPNGSSKLAIRLPEALHRAAKAKAAEEGRSLEAIIAEFVAQWVEPERLQRVEALLRGKTASGDEDQGAEGAGRRKGGK